MNPYKDLEKYNIECKLLEWFKIVFRFGDYFLVKIKRSRYYGCGEVELDFLVNDLINGMYYHAYQNQVHQANQEYASKKSEQMENKLRELGYSVESNIGYAKKLSVEEVTSHMVNPEELFIIKKHELEYENKVLAT